MNAKSEQNARISQSHKKSAHKRIVIIQVLIFWYSKNH